MAASVLDHIAVPAFLDTLEAAARCLCVRMGVESEAAVLAPMYVTAAGATRVLLVMTMTMTTATMAAKMIAMIEPALMTGTWCPSKDAITGGHNSYLHAPS
nr:uncharacterized protein LOC128705367 [Cherax quadricarinatus]